MTLPEPTDEQWFYYPWQPIPNEMDALVRPFVEAFMVAERDERAAMRARVTGGQLHLLAGFSKRMAALAVREKSIAHLRVALYAVALLGGSPRDDWRDNGGMLKPHRDAALRLGGAAREEFNQAAARAEPMMARMIRDAAPEPGVLGTLWVLLVRLFAADWWKPFNAPDGFRYGERPSRTFEELTEFVEKAKAFVIKLDNQIMNDGSRRFYALPEVRSAQSVRRIVLGMPGAVLMDFIDSGIECWVVFAYRGEKLSINNQFGEYWIFVDNAAADEAVLRDVVNYLAPRLR